MDDFQVPQNVTSNEPKPLTKSLNDIPKQDINWLCPGYIPANAITIIAGDGGVGKSTVICNIATSVTTGIPGLLPWADGKTGEVLLLNGEDDAGGRIKEQLMNAGADLTKIYVLDEATMCTDFKIGTANFEKIIKERKPLLCVIDPLQAFLPAKINMASRNAMRDVMMHLPQMSKQYGTTFMIICHTNKRKDSFGRNRISDSSDLFDIARSVFIIGVTETESVRYISHEKSNYGPLQDTLLFSMEGGRIVHRGSCKNKDVDYVMLRSGFKKRGPGAVECELAILDILRSCGGSCESTKLHEDLGIRGFSGSRINSVVSDMKNRDIIEQHRSYASGVAKVITKLIEPNEVKSTQNPSNTNGF